jgi:hypothetical protein
LKQKEFLDNQLKVIKRKRNKDLPLPEDSDMNLDVLFQEIEDTFTDSQGNKMHFQKSEKNTKIIVKKNFLNLFKIQARGFIK